MMILRDLTSLVLDEYCLWQLTKRKIHGERFANPLIVQNGKELPRDEEAIWA